MKYTLTGKVVPKARPRFGGGRAYLPQRYRDWKENAIIELLSQTRPIEPISKAEVSIELFGSHRGDLDNLAGSLLDSLVQAGILLDDRIGVVSKLSIAHHPNKVASCSVLILQLDPA
jgi:Holliday junction resolvase RusA-like endonuclease